MPPRPISATDAINPALETTKDLMFRPFQFGRCWRVGVLGIFTGGAAGFGGGCNIPSGGGDWEKIMRGTKDQQLMQFQGHGPFPDLIQVLHSLDPKTIALMITVLVVGILAIAAVHVYMGSILRFSLMDAVTNRRFGLREGWQRWQSPGQRYFFFQLALMVISLVCFGGMALLAGLMIAGASGGGAKPSPAGIILSLLVLLPVFLVFVIVFALFQLFAKDFAVPMMALEDLRVTDALRRVKDMLAREKGATALYVMMKIILDIASGIVVSIMEVFLFGAALIPVGILAVAAGIAVPALFKNPAMLAVVITAVITLIFALVFVAQVIASPVTIFFQAYVLHYMAPRYPPLWKLMHPAPPLPEMPGISPLNSPPMPPPLV